MNAGESPPPPPPKVLLYRQRTDMMMAGKFSRGCREQRKERVKSFQQISRHTGDRNN